MTVPENLAQYDTEENRKAYEALVNGNASAASTATSQVPDDLAKYDTDENRKAYEAYSKEHAFDNGFTVTYNGQTTSYTKEETDLLKRAYQTLNQNDDFAKSALESYGNNAFDQFAMQNGLPSWKMFSTVQKYAAGGGVAENYGNLSDDQWKKINELWAKDWEYGLSDQDYARKAAGLAPVSYDSMYEDTLLDQELKAKGLPPSKLLNGKLGEAYNTWVKDTNTRNDILQSIANDYVSGKLFFAENPATGKKETIDYDDADFMTSAILAAQSDPRYSEFFKNHYGVQQELPDEHDPKYIMYTKDPISGEKTPLYDESGNYLYDTNAWMEDRQKIINKNTALADDEFAITPDIVNNYITENGLSITADIATEKWFKANDPKFEHATRMANPEYIAKLVDFASAYEFVGEGGVTLASLFPNKQFTLAERTELQPLIDKINARALEQGMGVYEEYFKGGEWARDVHQIENNNIVAQYRENNADVDGYNDVGSKNYHSDDKILNEHYETLAKEYGIDKEMPLTDAVAKLRSGEMTIDAYLTDKCKTPEDAEAFAKMRYENYCKANNLPTTEKGWEENRELRSAAHDYINNELGDQQQDMLDTPESEWQNQHDVWGKIASKYKTKAEALKAQQNGAMPEHSQFDSVVAEWEYAVDKYAKASEALDIYAHIHELDPTWNNESARYEQQQYGTPVQASANAVRLSYLGESLSYAYKNVNIDNVEQRARQLFEDKAGIGMSSGLVLKSGALGAAGVLAGAPLPVGSAIAGALLSDSDKRKNMDALYDELTEEEKQKLVYMSMQYGADSDNVKDYINSVLLSAADRRRRQEQQAENGYWFSESDSATMRIFGGTANTLASALFIQPTESLANFISDTINIKTGNELLSSMRSNLGQDNISNIASNISEKAGKGWAFAYQLAPSMIQSVNQAVAAYLTKGASEIPTLISMAMQSYSSAVDDALQRGVSSKEAYYYGIMNGVAEYVFEKVSLDKFLSESNEALDTIIALKRAAKRSGTKAVVDRKLFAKAWLTILKNAPIQGLVEMSEETWTSLANYLSETALLSVDSTFDKSVEHYRAGGMSQEEAEKKAKEDVAKEIFGEGAAGFISGMLMSGGRSVMMMTSAAGTVHIDRTGMSEFLNATHNLSTISAVEAGNYVRTRLDLSGNSQITARQVESVMNELIRKGADAATLMRVRNEILAAKPSAAVGTVMNNIISEQSRNDAKRLINAAQRYITRTNKNGKTNISPEAIATVTNEYLSALQTRAQDRDVRNIQYATERIRSEYIANIASKTGVSQTASGMSALNEYFTALPQASQAAIQKDAEKYKVKFNGTGMTETDAAQYALYASILHDACTEANSTGAYTVLFGESAAYTPMAIENACLNSTGEEAAIFIDSVCDAIAALNGSTGTLTTAAMNGSNATAFAATQMAIARESSNVRAKAVYDYIVKHGASSDLMDMLTAANMLESLSPVERFALMSSIRVTGNNMMTNVQLDDIVGTYTKARENYEGQKRVMEEHQKSDAQKVIDEDARIAMYDTQIATLDAQIEAETDPKLKGTLMEKRADNAKARQDAITAKEEETRRRAERMASTQKELNSAKSSADKAQNDYNRSMRRHAAQYMQRMGDIYQGIMAHDHLSLVSIASKAAAVNYGDAKNLNDVQEIIRASEKASAVALGRMMGVTVEVVEFSEKFFDEKNVPKEYRKPNAPGVTIDGKVYLNEKSITAEVGSGTNAVILHEIGHVMEASADNYAKYAKFARQYFETRDGKESVDRWIASLVESGMTEENANKELVAEFTRQVALADPRAIRALTKSAPIMSMRIFQWLTNMKSALTPQALEQATTLRDAQLAFARAMKTVKKSGSEVSSVYDVAVNRAAIDNANETLDERARLEEQAKQTKTEQKTETPTATDEQQTTQTETPATTEETQAQPTVEETEQTAENVEEQPSETVEETPEETPTEEQPTEEPQEDFADIVLEEPQGDPDYLGYDAPTEVGKVESIKGETLAEDEWYEYSEGNKYDANGNRIETATKQTEAPTSEQQTEETTETATEQGVNLPFELTDETRQRIMRVVAQLRTKNADSNGRVPKKTNDAIANVVKNQVTHDANYVDTPADVLDAFAEQFKAPQNDVASIDENDIYERQRKLMQGSTRNAPSQFNEEADPSRMNSAFADIQQDVSIPRAQYYTEYDPQALAVKRNLDDMTSLEKTRSGNPRLIQTNSGYVVARTFSRSGFATGNPMMNGDSSQNIAMIAPVSAFQNGYVDRAVPVSQCSAVVIPNTDAYADMRTDARDAGAYVYAYDPTDPSMLDRAVDRAKDAQSVQYMPEMRYEDFLEKYGAHPYGAEPRVKNRPVPRQTTDTNRVSRMASNAATSPMTTEQGYEDIQGWIANHGTGTFTPQSNNRVLNRARGVIERAGDIHQAAADLDRDVANGIGKATDLLAIAELLYAQTQDPNSGLSVIEREKIFGNLCIIASDAGRALQLASRLKYMTPEGHIAYIEQVGKRIADKYEKRTGKRTVLKPTQEEIDAYKGAHTVEEMEEIDKKVSERFGEETSNLTWIDRVRNWRYFSMLGNPRTHFRNIVGNALMNPVARVKDSINSIYQLGMDKSDRTTAFVTKRADANTREFVNQMLAENLPRMQGVSEKYMEGVDNQSVRTIGQAWKTDVKSAALTKGRTAFGRALNRLSSFNSNMLELEDAKALSRRFRSAMYQIIQARGIDVSNITEQQKSDIVNYAMEESLRATFRDASALADALNKFANTNKATRLAMEAIVPFKRTPINIAKRSVEYSPLGLVNGLYKLFSANRAYNTDIKNIESMQGITDEERAAMRENAENTLKQNKIRAIDRLAAGTTGSLLTLIGMFASAMGWISIGRKDDEEAAFEQGLGKNTYSLNIGDLSIDLSAFSPAAVPLLMGTALYQAVGAEHDENFVSSMISVLAESVDPVTEMSMLSGIADALSSTSYGNEEGRNTRWFGAIAGNALESYVGQFVPTFVGQVNRTIDPYARSYTAGDDYWATKAFGSEIGSSVKSIQNKVFPWLSEPKVNIHGEDQRNYTNFGSWVRNFANNTLLPATIKVDQKNEIDDELIRLYGVVDSADLFPTKPSRNLGSYDNTPIKITSDSEYMQYQMEYGQTVYDMLEDLMSSPAYRMMTDTQKADAVERIIDQAKSATKKRWKAQKVANMK